MEVYFTSVGTGLVGWVDEPEPLSKEFLDVFFPKEKKNTEPYLNLGRCPAIKDFTKNIFVITSPYDYEITWDGDNFSSTMHTQEFFNGSILTRSRDMGYLSLTIPHIAMFAEKDLLMECVPAYYHDSEFVRNTIVIPGAFDIGQHFRRLECAFKFRNEGTIKIRRGDALYYFKLNTNEKITMKRFHCSHELQEISNSLVSTREGTLKSNSMNFYYNIFKKNKLRSTYLKLIRKNLL